MLPTPPSINRPASGNLATTTGPASTEATSVRARSAAGAGLGSARVPALGLPEHPPLTVSQKGADDAYAALDHSRPGPARHPGLRDGLPLRGVLGRDVPRFFMKALTAWRQVRSAPARVPGASLIAQPLRRSFLTLSAWQDRDALYAFARTPPHRGIMAGLRPVMRSSTFTFWDVPAEQLPLSWDDARRRLAE